MSVLVSHNSTDAPYRWKLQGFVCKAFTHGPSQWWPNGSSQCTGPLNGMLAIDTCLNLPSRLMRCESDGAMRKKIATHPDDCVAGQLCDAAGVFSRLTRAYPR